MANKKSKRRWTLRGMIWKAGKQIKLEERIVEVHSEGDLDRHEAKLKSDLANYAMDQLKDMKDVRIEVDSEIE